MTNSDADANHPLPPLDDRPCKAMEQLLAEGKIYRRQFRSLLFLIQAGYGFSSTPEDAAFIQKSLEEMQEEPGRE